MTKKRKGWSEKGHGNVVEALLKAGCNPDTPDADGNTALDDAGCHGDMVAAVAMLKANCNTNIQNNEGYTPLHLEATGIPVGVYKYESTLGTSSRRLSVTVIQNYEWQ